MRSKITLNDNRKGEQLIAEVEGTPEEINTLLILQSDHYEEGERQSHELERHAELESSSVTLPSLKIPEQVTKPVRELHHEYKSVRHLSKGFFEHFSTQEINRANVKTYLRSIGVPARKKLTRRVLISLQAIRDKRGYNLSKFRRKPKEKPTSNDKKIIEELTGKKMRTYNRHNWPMLASEYANFTDKSISLHAFLSKTLGRNPTGNERKLLRKELRKVKQIGKPRKSYDYDLMAKTWAKLTPKPESLKEFLVSMGIPNPSTHYEKFRQALDRYVATGGTVRQNEQAEFQVVKTD